ncbi:MAG: hypothetical protein K9W45_11660 [Candidatus Heimdallarchaeum aukensis]|uniref:Uncharacterized protein n=1 Tax=Candidatus Heimdallarchaeum aukensis TaxID=2876573 RepID=A0A9Y1BK38_9ARCH|nr:MAG: hypothetical protein K9W45_11660 [Candidatus Heimdallarchaeum aukensis]
MIVEDVSKPLSSTELAELIHVLYSKEISVKEFVDSIKTSRDETISLIKHEDVVHGYFLWAKDEEIDEEENKVLQSIFTIEDLVFLPSFENLEVKGELVSIIEEKARSKGCNLIEISIPSQSFNIISIFLESNKYELTSLRVSKELERKTEFVKIYTGIEKYIKPQLVELLVSKEGIYQLELIEEPSDYKNILERGFNPEIVSLIFDLEEKNTDELFEKINEITEWQEFSITLVSYLS